VAGRGLEAELEKVVGSVATKVKGGDAGLSEACSSLV
jgi:hypothetical protein